MSKRKQPATPLDLQLFFGQVLQKKVEQVEQLFDFGEDKEGYLTAKKQKGWLEPDQFKTLAKAVEELGGQYIRGQMLFRVPGPAAGHKVPETPPPQTTLKPVAPVTTTIPGAQMVSVKELLSNPFSSRLALEDPELDELAEHIKTYGVLEPILVRQKPSGNLEVVAGERRLAAAKKAGLEQIPAIVKSLSDEDAFILQLTENLQRKDLTEEEKSRGLEELARRTKWDVPQIASKLKMSERWVYKYLPGAFKRDYERAPESARRANLTETTQTDPSEPAGSEPARQQTVQQPLTTTTPGPLDSRSMPSPSDGRSIPPPEPKPEGVDVADFTCPECKHSFRITHVANNLHRLTPMREEKLESSAR